MGDNTDLDYMHAKRISKDFEIKTFLDLSSNDDKRIQSIDLIETYAYRINKDLVWKKKRNVTI